MPSAPLTLAAHFTFEGILLVLIWAVWVVLNLWIWQKTKATGNLLMLIGAGVTAFAWLMRMLGEGMSYWLDILALVALTAGYFLTVRPMVEAHLAKLREKIHQATAGHKGGGGGSPS